MGRIWPVLLVSNFGSSYRKNCLLRGALEVLDALSAMRPDGHRYTGSILDEMVYSSCTFLGSSDCSSWQIAFLRLGPVTFDES